MPGYMNLFIIDLPIEGNLQYSHDFCIRQL